MTASDDVPLRDYVDRRFDDLQRAIDTTRAADKEAVKVALDAAKEAVGVALTAQKEWREAANEWRGAMSDRERDFVKKDDMENVKALVGSLANRVEARDAVATGRKDSWGWIVGGLGVVLVVLSIASVVVALVTSL